ncbi:AAA family ATPase [Clostridium perfringens]
MNVRNIIDLIINAINNNTKFLLYDDMILIGENTSGKSNIIKGVIKGLKDDKQIYFIDSRNRIIPTKGNIIDDEFSKFKIGSIIECRIKNDNFNKRDVFSDNSGEEVILGELIKNNSKYIQLFKEVLNIEMTYEKSIDLVQDDVEQIYIDKTNLREISSGVQSKLRILMEVNFASENNCKIVFIDEFNNNLDYKASADFFIKLRQKYPNIRFIITSHDIYTLKGVSNADIVKIYKGFEKIESNICEIFDINDLDNLEMIDRKLFSGSTERNQKDKKDIILGNALKLILSGNNLDSNIYDELCAIDKDDLTLRQKVVRNYILERLKQI